MDLLCGFIFKILKQCFYFQRDTTIHPYKVDIIMFPHE